MGREGRRGERWREKRGREGMREAERRRGEIRVGGGEEGGERGVTFKSVEGGRKNINAQLSSQSH